VNSKRIFNSFVGAALAAALIEIILGLVLLPKYRPTAEEAYGSVKALHASPLTAAFANIHHSLSAVLIVFAIATVLQGLLSGAYRFTSKKLWVGASVAAVLFFLFQLTGHLLPWDQHAVRTAAVETGIAQGAPVLGTYQANLLRGGQQVGPQTLSFWFWAHVVVLTALLVTGGIVLVRKIRATGYSPGLISGLFLAICCVGVLLGLLVPVQYGPAALLSDYGNYDAKPEWYILPMHSLLNVFQSMDPSFGFIGSMVIPALVLLLVVLAPWLGKAEAPKKPLYGIVLTLLLCIGTGALSAISYRNLAAPAGPNVAIEAAPRAQVTPLDPVLVARGRALFDQEGCTDCHAVHGSGGHAGPVLDNTGTRHPDLVWQSAHLQNPHALVPSSTMPTFARLGSQKIQALAEYLVSLK
jgi:ubiquinol-cytochrome c reductase cytochrome b subunit